MIRILALTAFAVTLAYAADLKRSPIYKRVKSVIDATPSIDTHDHLRPFNEIPGRVKTDRGEGMTLQSLWPTSYLQRYTRVTPCADVLPGQGGVDEACDEHDSATVVRR